MIARLRWFGAAVLIWNLWLVGHYRIEGFPVLVLTFGFAIAFELIVIRGVRSISNASQAKQSPSDAEQPADPFRFVIPALLVVAISAFAILIGFSKRTSTESQPQLESASAPAAEAAPTPTAVGEPERTTPTTPLLYATIHGDRIVGTYFNRNPNAALSEITIEIVPADETNPFNQFNPRFVKVRAYAGPDSMSSQFSAPIGAPLNPNFHTLKVVDSDNSALHVPADNHSDATYVGWTQKSSGSSQFIIDPFASRSGIRYYRDVTGIIWFLYPPGQRPDLEPAQPGSVQRSTTGEPPKG